VNGQKTCNLIGPGSFPKVPGLFPDSRVVPSRVIITEYKLSESSTTIRKYNCDAEGTAAAKMPRREKKIGLALRYRYKRDFHKGSRVTTYFPC